MPVRDVRFSQSALLKILKDIFGAFSPAGATSTTSDSLGTVQRPVDDYAILERWDSVLLELKRTNLHLFLLTRFDGIELDPGFTKPVRRGRIATAEVDEDLASLLHVRDEKAANTDGGTFTADSVWRTRVINTVVTNEISGSSLSSNQITLPAGTYFIEASAPAFDVNRHKAKLRNVSDSTDVLIGTSEFARISGGGSTTHSLVRGRFTIASEKIFELQHQGETTQATNGFGVANNFGVVEVFSEIDIRKLS